MSRRFLATLLYWIDRLPDSPARWELEGLVNEAMALEARGDLDSLLPPSGSGVFLSAAESAHRE